MDRLHYSHVFFTLAYCLFTASLISSTAGPVFINPDLVSATVLRPTPVANQANYLTQTVYGFLDFTTTIGNTVMVFSPQSASIAAPEIPREQTKDVKSNTVIETKPSEPISKEDTPVIIQPSKTQEPVRKNSDPAPKFQSVVQVKSEPPSAAIISSKVEVKAAAPSFQVNVIEAKPSKVHSVKPVIISKVEVVEATPTKRPSSATPPSIITKVEVVSAVPPKPLSSKVEIVTTSKQQPIFSSVVEVRSDEEEPALIIGNSIGEPEYDFLSRQPSEVVEETYKVISLKPSSKFHLKPRPSAEAKNKAATKRADSLHPTGLVTKLGGTVVKDGTTTVHETSVIGTYISGKYAQVLQSTSHIQSGNPKAKISPSPSLRILKTAAPALGKSNKHHNRHLEPTPAESVSQETNLPVEGLFNSQNSIKSTRKPGGPSTGSSSSFKPRFKNRQKEAGISSTTSSDRENNEPEVPSPPQQPHSNYKKSQRARTQHQAQNSRSSSKSPGRWQYKTTAKPRVTIRKTQEDDDLTGNNVTPQGTSPATPQQQQSDPLSSSNSDLVTPQARSDDVDGLEGSESIASIIDDESSPAALENKLVDTPPFPLETLRVEISTPPDFKDIYYEIATIKSPYTFQVGNVKNTRYITVTSTFEKSLISSTDSTISPSATEPLTENILATSSNYAKDNNFLDSSIATLPPLYLASDMETPPLETLTETFSTTQTMLKTHILPIVHRSSNETTSSTLIQTYIVTRLVTATKTLPPMEAYHFIPSKILNEFNSHLDEAGSELHLELEFGDSNEQDEDGQPRRVFPPDLDLANVGSNFDLSDVDKTRIPEGHLRSKKAHAPSLKPALPEHYPTPGLNPEQLQQLALLRLLNPAAAAQGQVITTSKPVIKVETIYDTHVIPITNGHNTLLSTLSKIRGTITRTEFELGTSTLPPPALPALPPINPLYPQFGAAPQLIVTSSPVVQSSIVTQTNSKVLKLTFGAKTTFTTIFSTTVVPTLVTTYLTQSVPVQPTAAFPGFYPGPFPGYPYVG